jgi:DNA-binding LacI/PurR family transcriptional regulator
VSITLHDVARLAEVSIKTVSNVINDYPHVRPATKQKVLDAIDELGYQPNLSARSLRSGRTGVIGLIIPDLRNAYFAELAEAVMSAAAERNLILTIQQTNNERKREVELLRDPRLQMVDGILYSALVLGQEDVELLDIPTPLVLLGERIFNGPTDHVTMQNIEAAYAATEYLAKLGRKRILALGAHIGEVIGSAGLRLTGYRRALEDAGLPYDDSLVFEVQSWHRSDGATAMHRVLESGVQFDAMFAFNDALGLGAMRVLQEAGLRVPDDVAVIGFDDIDETRYSLPTMTTIDPGRQEIAETAVAMLMERIDSKAQGTTVVPREFMSSFRLIERESTAVTR